MRSLAISALLLSLATALLPAHLAQAIPHPLVNLVVRTEDTNRQHQTPVVVFDIDDTLLDTRFRTARIFGELALHPTFRTQYPQDSDRLLRIRPTQVQYSTETTLIRAGITHPAVIAEIVNYWKMRFFSDFYAAEDIQLPDAARYVRQLHRSGAIIVYLTGRPQETMRLGTQTALQRWRFPLDQRTALLMKPDAAMEDLVFKRGAMNEIARMGTVIGVFENEPANLNLLSSRFPEADLFFVDTIHSPKPDAPDLRSVRIDRY